MKIKTYMISLFITSAISASVLATEPVQPISPVKEINLAQVELGKKLFLTPDYQNPDLYLVIPVIT